jgi:uncharacterized lipoprotein YbaY
VNLRCRFVALLAVVLVTAGCGSLDVAGGGNPDRVLTGTIGAGVALPEGSEVVVRLMATPTAVDSVRPVNNNDAPVTRPSDSTGATLDRVLGEHSQKLTAGTMEPVPFRIEYQADDATLRRGLTIEARVSYGGKLRFRTVNAHVLTLASSAFRQDVNVQPVER